MTQQETIDLAHRAVACSHWRWMPGMKWIVKRDEPLEDVYGRVPDDMRFWTIRPGVVPDLSDPATLGCLLALVREVWGDPGFHAYLSDTYIKSKGRRAWAINGWIDAKRSPDGRGGSFGGWGYVSEAEALVVALESAPVTADKPPSTWT